ncbi:MAG: alpha-amylase family glycosyl hydrolase, partial [Sphaerochaetaceae bacterium]|nr:alpha-amylase family glycosyl hydrolase [Sphaerochaetaceae bacterium]
MMKQDREFRKRFDARKQELEALFQSLYGPKRQYLDQLEDRLVSFWEKRPDGLKLLDERRGMDPDWYMARSAVGLTMYTDLFAGNLKGLEQKVPYLKELGVTYLHLMPVLKMPQGENDGGYAVDDFNTIDPKFGTNDDFIHLTETLHAHGISLCLDFVMNHTSSTHTWAMLAKQGNKEFQERYQCYDDRTYPDQYEKTVPQVFPTTAPGNFIWCEEMHKWVLSSFYPFQWDLDYHNPVVLNEMVSSMLHLANMGVDVFRLDAVPYIWKELGTTCRNLPQVHTIVRLFRIACEIVCPAVALKGEVVMAPRELAAYFGSP